MGSVELYAHETIKHAKKEAAGRESKVAVFDSSNWTLKQISFLYRDTTKRGGVGDPGRVSIDRSTTTAGGCPRRLPAPLPANPPKRVARDDDIDADLGQKSKQIPVAVRQ